MLGRRSGLVDYGVKRVIFRLLSYYYLFVSMILPNVNLCCATLVGDIILPFVHAVHLHHRTRTPAQPINNRTVSLRVSFKTRYANIIANNQRKDFATPFP